MPHLSAWKNGRIHGPNLCFGFRILKAGWNVLAGMQGQMIVLNLPGGYQATCRVPIKGRKCPEVRGRIMETFLRNNGHIPWPFRQPPRFTLVPSGTPGVFNVI